MAVVSGHPQVTVREIDLSVRVPGFPGVYGAIVIPAKRGPIDEPQLITSETKLLRTFTPNEKIEVGYDLGYFSAAAFLQKANKLWVKRAIGDNYLYGGAVVNEFTVSGTDNETLGTGEEDPTAYDFVGDPDAAVLIHAADPGDWSDDFGFRLWLQRDREDVLLGDAEGNLDYGPPTIATGTIVGLGESIPVVAEPGVDGNVTISFADSATQYGTKAITSISIILDAAGFVGNEYILISSPYEDYYVWCNKNAGGVDPAPGQTLLGEFAVTDGDPATVIADALATVINNNVDFACPIAGTATFLVTADRTGEALAVPTNGTMLTQATVFEATPGIDSGVSVTYDPSADTVVVLLEDLQTPQEDVKDALEALPILDTVTTTTLDANEGWNVLWLGCTLTGGSSGANTITVTQFFASGEPIRFAKSGDPVDVMPAGIVENTTYYTIEVDDLTIKLAPTQTDALAGTSEIDIVDAGIGTMVLIPLVDIKEPDGIQIEVYKKNNENYPVEQWIVSRTPGAKNGLGNNMFIEDMLEGSLYLRAVDNANILGTLRPQVTVLYLGGGDDGDDVTDGKMILAVGAYNDPAGFPVTCLMDGGWATPAYQTALKDIAENRFDCVALLSVPYDKEASSNYLNEIVDYRRTILNMSSSFAAMYSPHVKIYDKFNDRYLYVAPDGYAGAAISFTALNFEMWYPVGGFKRGGISVLDTRRRYTKGELDYLYDNDVNPIRFYPGKGVNIWGQKTLYGQPSALDRLNVRLLLIVLEPALESALENFLFELNDEATRRLVKAMIDDYMEGVKGRRGVYEFYTQCDDDNNTPSDIDNHLLNVHVFIKPTLSVEYIPLTMVIMRTGLSLQLAQQSV